MPGRKEPGLDTRTGQVLDYIRRHPGCDTDEIAQVFRTSTMRIRVYCRRLLRDQLVGRQRAFLPHEYLSKWFPEKVD